MITTFLETEEAPVTKYLELTVIEFLDSATSLFLEANDITVTKFLETALANFLLDSRWASKFLEKTYIPVPIFWTSQ